MKIGIDIGNKFARVAIKKPNGNLLSVPDSFFADQLITPLHICFEQHAALIGKAATIKEMEGVELNQYKSFKQQLGIDQSTFANNSHNNWHPTSLLTLILQKLKNDCEAFSGEPISDAVLTIPSGFGPKQKKAIVTATLLAGIPVSDIISEPMAAIQYYKQLEKVEDNGLFLICDIGDSALKLAILSVEEEQTNLLAEQHYPTLGAYQIEKKLESFLIELVKNQTNIHSTFSHFDLLQVKKLSMALLVDLSSKDNHYFKKKIRLNKHDVTLIISRKELEDQLTPLLDQIADRCNESLQAVHLAASDLSAIFLTGCSASLSIVPLHLSNSILIEADKMIVQAPTKANAFGAALWANQLTSKYIADDLPAEFRGQSSYNVGIKTVDPETTQSSIDIVVHRSVNLPSKGNRVYHFVQQEAVPCILEIVINQSAKQEAKSIGQLALNAIFDEGPQQSVEVVFIYNELGHVHIQAYSPQSGMKLEEKFTYLTEEELHILEQKELIGKTLINDLLG